MATPVVSISGSARRRSWAEKLTLAAVGAALAALLAIVVSRGITMAGSPALAATPAPLAYRRPAHVPTGRQLLLQLAAAAARTPASPVGDGPYRYVKSQGWYLATQVAGGKASSAVVPSVTESWMAPDGSGRVLRRSDPAVGDRLDGASQGSTVDDFKLPPTDSAFGRSLSTDPRILVRQLEIEHPARIGPVDQFVALRDLALQQPIPQNVESTVLQILAGEPNVHYDGSVVDRAGRAGLAVSLTSAYTGVRTRYTLIFDRVGKLLGEEETIVGNPRELNVRSPSVIGYTTFLASGEVATTNSRP